DARLRRAPHHEGLADLILSRREAPSRRMKPPTSECLARPEHAVLAHHLDQHALAQAAVGNPQSRQWKGVADRIEDGAAGEHQIGALDADAIVGDALLVAHAEQPRDGSGYVCIVHPDTVDAAAVIA